MSKIILYIATSKDGFIADNNGGVDWLPQPKDEHELEVVGYHALLQSIDTILMGSNSFKQIMAFGEWGWPDKQTYVFSSKQMMGLLPCIAVTHEEPVDLVKKLQQRNSTKDIWLLGGAALVQSFARDKLIDEIILTVVPQILGNGIALDLNWSDFNLINERPILTGMLQQVYLKKLL